MKTYYVYIMASQRNGTLYGGVISDLIKRAYQHRTGAAGGFTQKYEVKTLVWYETTDSLISAIMKEKKHEDLEKKMET